MRVQIAECFGHMRSTDSTDTTEVLSDDNVWLNRFQAWKVDEVKAATFGKLVPDGLVDLLGRKITVNQRIHDDRLTANLRGIVALEGHSRNAFAHPECVKRFRCRREEGTDLHSN